MYDIYAENIYFVKILMWKLKLNMESIVLDRVKYYRKIAKF